MRVPVQIRRDPFARASLMRRVAEYHNECDWCGNTEKRTYFQYAWEDDGLLNRYPYWTDKAFCNVQCWEAYNY